MGKLKTKRGVAKRFKLSKTTNERKFRSFCTEKFRKQCGKKVVRETEKYSLVLGVSGYKQF